MIWSADRDGACTYLSEQWEEFTGQTVAAGLGSGWQFAIHGDDLDLVVSVFRQALAEESEFWMLYRLRRREGGFAWIMGGAVPSRSPITNEFLGFLGSITFVELRGPVEAHGEVSTFRPPAVHPITAPKSHLDMLADIVLIGRAIAEEAGYGEMTSIMDDLANAVMLRTGHEASTLM